MVREQDTIFIATAFDASYVQHVGVMLCSLFENNSEKKFHIYLLQRDVDASSIEFLMQFIRSYQQFAEVKNVAMGDPAVYKVSGHITLASYLRVFIPSYVDQHVNKLLYLDADIIINDSIEALWKTNISAYSLGAVEDVNPHHKLNTLNRQERMYFNAGVLLVNLKKWRNDQTMQETLAYISDNREHIVFHDQDALNAVLGDKWLPLHQKFNMQGALFMDEFTSFRGNPDELKEAIRNPVIIHYSTPLKPWHYLSYHPYTSEYFKYLALTPWKDIQPEGKTPIRVLRKTIRPYLRKVGITKVFGKHLY